MGFEFRGAFSLDAPDLLERAVQKWPDACVKRIRAPFYGVAIRFGDYESDNECVYESDLERVAAFEEELPKWTAQFPDVPFVFVKTSCFGGTCTNRGFVACNGVVVCREEGRKALTRLVRALGARLNYRERFAPLERGWWT